MGRGGINPSLSAPGVRGEGDRPDKLHHNGRGVGGGRGGRALRPDKVRYGARLIRLSGTCDVLQH